MSEEMSIGELARKVGVRSSAIRYYEAQDLLPPARRARNKYRRYGHDAVISLRFIQRARTLGFSLDEIRQIVDTAKLGSPCALSRRLIERHITQITDEMRRLQTLRRRLQDILADPPEAPAEGEPWPCRCWT